MAESASTPVPEAEAVSAEVDVLVGGEAIAMYTVSHGEYLIGRDASCPIFVDADDVSRHHARLIFNAFELVIEDLAKAYHDN